MTTAGDFIRLPKADFHNHLDSGMRSSSYISWAGFYIPEMTAREIELYSKIRIKTEKDVMSLLSLSLYEAEADNVKSVEGTVDLELNQYCQTPANFIELIQKTIEKYSGKIEFKPYLGFNSDTIDNVSLARSFLSSSVFAGVDIYGRTVSENPEYYAEGFASLHQHNLKIKFHSNFIKTRDQLEKIISVVKPEMILDSENKTLLKDCAGMLASAGIIVCLSPDNSDAGEKARFIRSLLDSGVTVKLGTSSILFNNKTLSDFASSLCNTEILSKEEVSSLFC